MSTNIKLQCGNILCTNFKCQELVKEIDYFLKVTKEGREDRSETKMQKLFLFSYLRRARSWSDIGGAVVLLASALVSGGIPKRLYTKITITVGRTNAEEDRKEGEEGESIGTLG